MLFLVWGRWCVVLIMNMSSELQVIQMLTET